MVWCAYVSFVFRVFVCCVWGYRLDKPVWLCVSGLDCQLRVYGFRDNVLVLADTRVTACVFCSDIFSSRLLKWIFYAGAHVCSNRDRTKDTIRVVYAHFKCTFPTLLVEYNITGRREHGVL